MAKWREREGGEDQGKNATRRRRSVYWAPQEKDISDWLEYDTVSVGRRTVDRAAYGGFFRGTTSRRDMQL